MNAYQKGFTLVELVVVIVILGILAATALPKFVDLSADAGTAATKGVAGALASATAANYAAKAVGNAGAVAVNVADVCTSAILGGLIAGVTLATGAGASANSNTYNITAGTGSCLTNPGGAVTCTLQGSTGVSFAGTIICSG